MSDKLHPLSIRRLLNWILEEEKEDRIFGIYKGLFFIPHKNDVFRMHRYGQLLETPIGVAAGPHTQMAQNIITSWLLGARYIELKTVQTLDELDVSKPCIDMEDEGYNCEWSQELRLLQSFDEYLNAWILIHVLKDKFGWGNSNEPGVIFNMSVGYDMAGILKPNVQHFFDKMKNCEFELNAKLDAISGLYSNVKDLNVSPQITDNITLSTMHGCPPDEIEKIGRYLIEERQLNTTIKLNPTLLGSERLRYILNNQLGYDEIYVPDEAFEHDLKYSEGVTLFKNLQKSAEKNSVHFGLKLTNTLEVKNYKNVFPSKETMMYMSGRALHPISINLAEKIQCDFDGQLDISFSAGVDAFNVSDVIACNIKPVTTCTDILKPGGYGRLNQYLEELYAQFNTYSAKNIDEFILAKYGGSESVEKTGLENLRRYAQKVLDNRAYSKYNSYFDNIKTGRKLESFDCISAPCVVACSTDQDIPKYMYYTAVGDYQKAFEVIMKTNPLPGITGYVCDHLCQTKCTRNNIDKSLLIREIKRFITEQQRNDIEIKPALPNRLKVAIIGAGPSGLSCAYFLALDGFSVDVFETKGLAGGMVSSAIPAFRLTDKTIQKDITTIEKLGVNFQYNMDVSKNEFKSFQRDYDYIYLALGAQRNKNLGIPGENLSGVIEPLEFLSDVRQNKSVSPGSKVAIIGGGNTAIDAARTILRLICKGGSVSILYRRTRKEMPAGVDEIQAVLDEGINIIELVAPEKIIGENGVVKSLLCSRMSLGEKDASGRPSPVKIPGSEFEFVVDTIIPAIGQEVVMDFISNEDLLVDPVTNETRIPKVYAGGDVIRGASSVINAVGDGKRVAENIIKAAREKGQVKAIDLDKGLTLADYQRKIFHRDFGVSVPNISQGEHLNFSLVHKPLTEEQARAEANRCLCCDDICNVCVNVCPNLANISYMVQPHEYSIQQVRRSNGTVMIEDVKVFHVEQQPQILNIGDFCNECGNCTTFCPTRGAPYKVKPRFFMTEESFQLEDEGYFLQENMLTYKSDGNYETLIVKDNSFIFDTKDVNAVLNRKTLKIESIQFKSETAQEIIFEHAAQMAVLLENLNDFYLFRNL